MVSRVHFDALFDPKGVVVAGASSHPGKFGFVSLHNILRGGYQGRVQATNLNGETVLGIETVASLDDLDDGSFDLVFVCTPASTSLDLLRAAHRKGAKAVFLTNAGYGEAGESGQRAQDELVAVAEELDMLVAGPNGQGVVSTPSNLCAQIVAPYPPAGGIGLASQSGNFVSSFMNYATASGIGISRAVSAGNAAQVTVGDYLEYFAGDEATSVGLAYIEGVGDGRDLYERFRTIAEKMPLVVVRGGATAGGAQAAASHTGALAADDAVFDGMCAQAGVVRAPTIESAFDIAATFATQPLPKGPNTCVLTTAGGWGVVTADAIHRSSLTLMDLPADLRDAIDAKLPPRWSRSNPVDLAGAETRDTIPEVMQMMAEHPDVDAIVYIGLGIQTNQATLMKTGPYYPEHGTGRIVEFHERQDERYAAAACDISVATGKPILTATELAVTNPSNSGPAAVRTSGRFCYPSSNRAVAALDAVWRTVLHRAARAS